MAVHDDASPASEGSTGARDSRARIDLGPSQWPTAIDQSVAVLAAARDRMGPLVYVRDGGPCRIRWLEKPQKRAGVEFVAGAPIIETLSPAALQLTLARCARFFIPGRQGAPKEVHPSIELCHGILASPLIASLPRLAGITEAPVALPDGRLIDRAGYDAKTGLYYAPDHDFERAFRGSMPRAPGRLEARQAFAELADLLAGFPFVSPIDQAVACAAIITALVRPTLRSAPGFAVSATAAATGKSLLVSIVALIASGRDAAVFAAGRDPEALAKKLFAFLLAGARILAIDNVSAPLDSDTLNVCLTQPTLRDRLLGASRMVEVSTSATITATGNNLVIGGDLATRMLRCRIDARIEDPSCRVFPVDLIEKLSDPGERARLVAAALTVVLAYRRAGSPSTGLPPVGRFEAWGRMVRDGLVWAGAADSAASLVDVKADDPDRQNLRAFMAVWWRHLADEPATCREAIVRLSSEEASEILDGFRDRGEVNTRKLGKYLSRHRGRVLRVAVGDDGVRELAFVQHGLDRDGMNRWQLVEQSDA